jgi:hypothetical protein
MRIVIETIPLDKMRYDTVGDYFEGANGELIIQVAEKPGVGWTGPYDPRLIALHELVEALLCQQRGIGFDEVDAFDFAFKGEGEPGDDPASPYRHEHRFAAIMEHQLAYEMGVDGYGVVS